MKFTKLFATLSLMVMLTGCAEGQVGDTAKNASKDLKDKTENYVSENKDSWKSGWDKFVNGIKDSVNGTDEGSTDNGATQASLSNANDFDQTAKELSEMDYTPGTAIDTVVNDSKSTLNIADWKGPQIEYSNLDELNRTGTAVAHLTKENWGPSEGRAGQKWSPTAWNNQAKKVDGKDVRPMDRGHLIAYTLSFNLDNDGKQTQGEDGSIDNPKNLISQTSYSNRGTYQKYEEQVRKSIKDGHKVIFRVQPIYRGDELMARGVWAQAVSDDGMLNFNVYVHNVQPNFKFDYSTGKSVIDKTMIVE